MADQNYSKPNPYGKPPKNETLAQKHDRVSKFYSYQRKADQQAAAKGDVTAMDQLMQIGRKKGGTQGAQLQREGAERKLGINPQQARNQDYANRPGGDNARMAQGQAMAMGGEGAGAGAGALMEKLAPLIARMRGGAGQAAQMARPPAQAMQRPALPAPRLQLPPGRPPMGSRPMGGQPMPQPGQVPQAARPMSGQAPRALQPAQPGSRPMAPRPAAQPVRKSLSVKAADKSVRSKSPKDEVSNQRVTGRYSTTPGKTIAQGGKPSQSGVKSSSVRKASTPAKSAKGSQRSGESTKSTAGNGKTSPRGPKTIGGKKTPTKVDGRSIRKTKFDKLMDSQSKAIAEAKRKKSGK